ncbi:hypothetical protein ACFOG5_24695 [Pedobacter fastidiosus]
MLTTDTELKAIAAPAIIGLTKSHSMDIKYRLRLGYRSNYK